MTTVVLTAVVPTSLPSRSVTALLPAVGVLEPHTP
jgi:hypothetical protein